MPAGSKERQNQVIAQGKQQVDAFKCRPYSANESTGAAYGSVNKGSMGLTKWITTTAQQQGGDFAPSGPVRSESWSDTRGKRRPKRGARLQAEKGR